MRATALLLLWLHEFRSVAAYNIASKTALQTSGATNRSALATSVNAAGNKRGGRFAKVIDEVDDSISDYVSVHVSEWCAASLLAGICSGAILAAGSLLLVRSWAKTTAPPKAIRDYILVVTGVILVALVLREEWICLGIRDRERDLQLREVLQM